jgi:hypothetical protein
MVQYGYRVEELPPEIYKKKLTGTSPGFKVGVAKYSKQARKERLPISRTCSIFMRNQCKPIACPDDLESTVLGMAGRVGVDTPKMHSEICEALKKFTLGFCQEFLTPLDPSVDLSAKWFEEMNQSKARKDELAAAELLVNTEGIDSDLRFLEACGFIKYESYDEYKLHRSIMATADEFKAYCGPIFHSIGDHVFHTCDEFIKTVPVSDRPEYILDRLAHELGKLLNGDATSYEAHFKRVLMESIEFVLYDYMVSLSPLLQERMERIKSVLSGPRKIKFKSVIIKLMAKRLSGEMNTSLGNGFTTMIITKFLAWLKEVIVPLVAEGDDNLATWLHNCRAPTKEEYEALGWLMKVEEPKSVGLASLCGQVFEEGDKIVVCDPRAALADFGWLHKKYVNAGPAVRMQLMRSKALSMVHQYNRCPLLGAFGRRVEFLTRGVVIRKSIMNNFDTYKREALIKAIKDPLPPVLEVPYTTRALVEYLYNIPVSMQLDYEKQFELLQLGSSFEPLWPSPPVWQQCWNDYVARPDEIWAYKGNTYCSEVEEMVRAMGNKTRKFVDSYYDSRLKAPTPNET